MCPALSMTDTEYQRLVFKTQHDFLDPGPLEEKNEILLGFFLVFFSYVGLASEANTEEEHGAEEAHHRLTLALFAAITHEEGENRETLGIEYSYRINELWSVGE